MQKPVHKCSQQYYYQRVKQLKSPSNEEWINKLCYLHITEYNSAIKKDEVLTHATTRMNLENTMLHERNQSQRTAYWMIPFR